MRSSMWMRGAIAGAAGGVAWLIGIMIFFGPAQIILTDPEWQSEKMLAAFTGEPLPRAAEAPWILPIGLLVISVMWGWVYVHLSREWARSGVAWWKRGIRFALVAWVLLVPWFAFFLPWNVLREPAGLVLLEMMCWAGVMLCVGITIAGVEHAMRPRGNSEVGDRARTMGAA
jgi:hypothetical protein